MIVSAMIFAGLTLIIGIALGFLLGQARARMSYEERLREVETARAELTSQADELRKALQEGTRTLPPGLEEKPANEIQE